MSDRFSGLKKVAGIPAAKILSEASLRLATPLDSPANASCSAVLTELETKAAWTDMLMLIAAMLPPRERVWWAVLAARDYIGAKSKDDPPPLAAAEAWVFKPDEENREAARASLDNAYVDDDTVHCANAVLYSDGTLGPGDLAQHAAPAGIAELSAFGMNVVALNKLSDKFETHVQLLIDRGVDIARGGNGNVRAGEVLEGEAE